MTVVPYIGTWIETSHSNSKRLVLSVVPYIGTWIETFTGYAEDDYPMVVPYIGTWIETNIMCKSEIFAKSRTLYRYVD